MNRFILASACFVFFVLLSSSAFAQSGTITTYAGPGLPVDGTQATTQPIDYPAAMAVDAAGNFYVASLAHNKVRVDQHRRGKRQAWV